MKKFVIVLLAVLSLGVLVSCRSGNDTKSEEINQIEMTREEEKEAKKQLKELKKIEKIDKKIKEKELIKEKEFDDSCEHEYIQVVKLVDENLDYYPQVMICLKCKGEVITGYIEKESQTENIDESLKMLEKIFKENNK